jgi:flavodoxin
MKKIYFAVPIIAAFLVVIGMQAQKNFTTAEAEDGVSKMGKTGELEAKPDSGTKKILVAYYSHTGNTREIANQIHKIAGGDIFEIQAVTTYPDDYEEVKKRARQELDSGYKPVLKTKINNIKSYDIVFIGYPIWWGTFAAPVKTFLSEYDFSGKTIVPFCTHGGSGLGRSITDITALCPHSTILDGLAVWGKDAKTAQNDVAAWVCRLKVKE